MSVIQALVELGATLKRRNCVPIDGYSNVRIGYIIDLDVSGEIVTVSDIIGEKRTFQVPMGGKRSVNILANLLWDKCEYALGLGIVAAGQEPDPKTALRFAEFHRTVRDLPRDVLSDAGVKAVLLFLDKHDPAQFRETRFGTMIAEYTANIAFRLHGDEDLVCQREAVQEYVANKTAGSQIVTCMVTGKSGEIARLHPAFSGIFGAKPTGATLISFNMLAANYYIRDQGENAPITEDTASAYGTALRYALQSDHKLRFRMADNVMLGWANTTTLSIPLVAELLSDTSPDQSDEDDVSNKLRNANTVKEVFYAPNLGVPAEEMAADYHIVGLTGVDARIAVSFYQHGRLGDLVHKVNDWLNDLSLAGRPPTARHSGQSIFHLLLAMAPPKAGGKKDLDQLAGRQQTELLFAALNGTPVPTTIANQAMSRLRIGGYPDDEHTLTAFVKLYLNRNYRKGLTVTLDESRRDPGYLYGRLFAIIERAQAISAGREVNATIRDKFWSSASTTPTRAFPVLNRLFIVYLKREKKIRWLQREYESVMSLIETDDVTDDISDMSQQMLFAIGYWQQRTALYSKKVTPAADSQEDEIHVEA